MTNGGRRFLPPPVRGFRANRGWRTAVFARAEAVRAELVLASQPDRFTLEVDQPSSTRVTAGTATRSEIQLAGRVAQCVDDAVIHASAGSNPFRWLAGSHNEGAWSRLHTADLLLVELMSSERLAAYAPSAVYLCRRELPASDPRRVGVERIARAVARRPSKAMGPREREVIRAGIEAAYARNEEHYQRGRSLRNMTIAMASFMFVLALAAVLLGWNSPRTLPMCLESDASTEQARAYVCPIRGADPAPGDVALVALVGMAGAGLSAARALSGVTKRLGPYSPVVAQGTLKIVLGALFAILGVTVLRAGWVPGVDDVDSGSEILTWAFLFGFAQQVLTGLLDQRAENVLTRGLPEADGTAVVAPGADVVPDPEDDEPADETVPEGEATDAAPATDVADEMLTDAVPADAVDDAADPVPDGANVVPDVPPADDAPVDEADLAVDEGDAEMPEGDAPEEAPPPRPVRKRAPSKASGGSSRPSGRRRGAGQGG